ncbi:MAG TPA: dipeptide epimerase [Cyclobacteriaceae bacterium]|nr:dipeptide epimerase [Cyclobacteriaceae bacterium]
MSVSLIPVDIPLTDHFVISQGEVRMVRNIFVEIRLQEGTPGYGEITPFPELAGADRENCMRLSKEVAAIITGKEVSGFKKIVHEIREATPGNTAVRCGFETAIIDALCRSLGISLGTFWGGRETGPFETDITIPILSFERSMELARHWHSLGFRKFKIKVGVDAHKESRLINTIFNEWPGSRFIIDANQGFTPDEAIQFATALQGNEVPVIMFEQPVNKKDIDGMARVRNSISIPVAADESAASLPELREIISKRAADIINLKIMKTGLFEAIDIAVTAHSMGLKLMIGGMIETRIAMGCSLALVSGLGIIEHLDLDTPLLMVKDPVEGGYHYEGPWIFPSMGSGLDISIQSGL